MTDQKRDGTATERGLAAVDWLTGEFKEYHEKKGKILTHEEAHKLAENVAYRSEKRTIRKNK